MVYYCVFCGKRLNRRKKKYCSNNCKCKQFHKEHPKKCNIWNKNNPRLKVNNECLTCGTPCGRKKYCSDECKPKIVYIPPYLKGMARFNTKCYACKKTFILVHIHHLNGDDLDNRRENLISLCPTCHAKLHNKKHNFQKLNERQKGISRKLEEYRKFLAN